jgi:hypothetical protein
LFGLGATYSVSQSNVFFRLIEKRNPRQDVATKCEAFQGQGGTTFPPQPSDQNSMDAVLIWKWN